MNNKGQSTVLLIILIPVFMLLGALITDTAISMYQTKKLKNTTETIVKDVLNNDEYDYTDYQNEIKKAYERNKYKTNNLIIISDEYNLYLHNEVNYFSLFSSLLNKKSISIIALNAKKEENQVKIEYVNE